jgi:tetratricopeptide (TPR) repeat protein
MFAAMKPNDWIEIGMLRVLARWVMGIAVVLATTAIPVSAQIDDMKNCEQMDSSVNAIRACTAVLASPALSPADRVRVYMRRSKAWIIEEEPAAAAEDYSHALDIEPKNLDALQGRAKAHALAAAHAAAVSDFTQLIAEQPGRDDHFSGRGASQLALGQYEAALADHAKAIEINPKNMDAYIGRAHVFDALKDRPKALIEFDRAIAADPKVIRVYWVRGEMADSWGEKQIAIDSYVKVLSLNGVYEDARRRLQKLGILHPP